MIRVYHAENPLAMVNPSIASWPNDYLYVAVVNAGTLEEAFYRTNNVDNPWPENRGVIARKRNLRSTSVGDVLVKEDVAYRCMPMGWEAIPK